MKKAATIIQSPIVPKKLFSHPSLSCILLMFYNRLHRVEEIDTAVLIGTKHLYMMIPSNLNSTAIVRNCKILWKLHQTWTKCGKFWTCIWGLVARPTSFMTLKAIGFKILGWIFCTLFNGGFLFPAKHAMTVPPVQDCGKHSRFRTTCWLWWKGELSFQQNTDAEGVALRGHPVWATEKVHSTWSPCLTLVRGESSLICLSLGSSLMMITRRHWYYRHMMTNFTL